MSPRQLVAPRVPAARPDAAQTPPAAVPVRVRRRPAFLVASVALLLAGALAGVWLWTAATSTVEVLAARATVPRGAVITASDLLVVRVGVDPALRTVPAGDQASVVGKRAGLDIAAGGLITAESVTEQVLPAKGLTVVGLALGVGLLPATPLHSGDQVRIVYAPSGAPDQLAPAPVSIAASVVGATQSPDGQAALVDVLVPASAAPGLAAQATAGKVALVLDSRER